MNRNNTALSNSTWHRMKTENTLPHLIQVTPILNQFCNSNKISLRIRLSISLTNNS